MPFELFSKPNRSPADPRKYLEDYNSRKMVDIKCNQHLVVMVSCTIISKADSFKPVKEAAS